MIPSLRIAVADDEPDMRDYFARILPMLGHRVVVLAADGEELLAGCRANCPDLVITDINMPVLDGLSAAARLCQEMPLPIILVSAYRDLGLMSSAESDFIMASLVKPIKQANLGPAIALALERFEQCAALRQEAADVRLAKTAS
jgi:AmiR/NasT family two-component response regulator